MFFVFFIFAAFCNQDVRGDKDFLWRDKLPQREEVTQMALAATHVYDFFWTTEPGTEGPGEDEVLLDRNSMLQKSGWMLKECVRIPYWDCYFCIYRKEIDGSKNEQDVLHPKDSYKEKGSLLIAFQGTNTQQNAVSDGKISWRNDFSNLNKYYDKKQGAINPFGNAKDLWLHLGFSQLLFEEQEGSKHADPKVVKTAEIWTPAHEGKKDKPPTTVDLQTRVQNGNIIKYNDAFGYIYYKHLVPLIENMEKVPKIYITGHSLG